MATRSGSATRSLELRMAQSIRETISKITKEKALQEVKQSHYLNGTFRQLCEPSQMRELLFPGTPKDILDNLPKDLKEVLEWSELELNFKKIAQNAAEVLENIKVKGARQGNVMDEQTERVLLPQIAQEALSKGVIEAVRRLNLKVSATVAKVVRAVASADSERAQRDQLDDEVIEQFLNSRYCVQNDYVGEDWRALIREDLQRFLANEKMSRVDENGQVVVSSDDSRIEELLPHSSMCWLEKDEKMKETYPALYELLDCLHSLPHELNAKCNFQKMQLLEAGRGSTMMVHLPVDSHQRMRLDNIGGDFDSGLRLTCGFYLRVRNGADQSSPSKLILQPRSSSGQSDITEISLTDDILIIHDSLEMRNERKPDKNDEWFAILFWAHGKDVEANNNPPKK